MSRVVACIDESAAAPSVLATARALADHLGAQLEALHVIGDSGEAAREHAAASGVPLRTVRGPAVASLLRVGHAEDVALVVLGARGAPQGRRPAGRTALEIVTSLARPVVVVPPDLAHPGRLRRLLLPLDDTTETAAALSETIELACSCDLALVVLHVHVDETLPPFEDQPQHETRSWTEEFLVRNCPQPPEELELVLRLGDPKDYVVRVAAEHDVDLIALGWSRDLSPGHAAVVRETLAHSTVPVLLVPLDGPVQAGRGGARTGGAAA